MPIISPLPYTIAPNTLADATQVQGNFDAIVAGVNANAAPIGGGGGGGGGGGATGPTGPAGPTGATGATGPSGGGSSGFGHWVGNLNGTDQTLTSTSTQTIIFSNTLIDALAEYNVATGVFTAAATGVYLIAWQFAWTTTGGPSLNGQINRNTINTIVGGVGTTSIPIVQSIVYPLTVGDTIIFRATRDATANKIYGSTSFTFASIARIG